MSDHEWNLLHVQVIHELRCLRCPAHSDFLPFIDQNYPKALGATSMLLLVLIDHALVRVVIGLGFE